MIARQSSAATYPEELAEQGMKALAAVRKVPDDKETPEDISIDELLTKANVSHSIYLCGLKMCSARSSIVMQRKPSESWINTYNPDVIRVWRANVDLQFVLDPYACVPVPISCWSRLWIWSSMSDPTIEISSMITSLRLDSLVLSMLSLSCVRGREPNLEVPSRSAECRVIPWMLKAATL